MTLKISPLVFLGFTLALASCSTSDVASTRSETLEAHSFSLPRIEVKRVELGQQNIHSRSGRLSARERQRLTDLIEFHSNSSNLERLHLALSGGNNGLAQNISRHAISQGVLPGNIHRVDNLDAKARTARGATIIFETYTATPPTCEPRVLSNDLFASNEVDRGFGCATLNDLALTVADPFDLIGRPNVRLTQARRPSNAISQIRTPAAAAPPN